MQHWFFVAFAVCLFVVPATALVIELLNRRDSRRRMNGRINREDPCSACGLRITREGHDGCIGTLPGVMNACCGHGQPDDAYVQFPDGTDLRGQDAIDYIRNAGSET